MDKTYKAIQYKVTTHHDIDAFIDKEEPWNNSPAYDTFEMIYCIVSTDIQGYGYKTAQKAYAAFAYKNRDKSKDKEHLARKRHIEQWMEQNKSFVKLMDSYAFEIAKGTMAPNDKFDAKFVRKLCLTIYIFL
ncbi:hypothetical protein SAMN05216391_11625 [Lachnospiraceae bacterium KHCPX20]|nr:hypothetical protein SAMN05216391_11625 [Lachnospiraceae bacterium KHCPX20]